MKRLLIGALAVVLVLVVMAIGASLLVDADHFRPQVQAALGKALGREVTLGKLRMSVWSGSLDADDIRIGEDPAFGTRPFVTARSLKLGVRLWPLLLHRRLHVTSFTLDQPQVRLMQNREGGWNFARLGGGKAASAPAASAPATSAPTVAPAFTVDQLRVDGGRLELHGAAGDVRVYSQLRVSADHVGTQAPFPFTLGAALAGGGTLALDGTLGPWDARNALLTPVDAHLALRDLDLVGAGLMARSGGVGGVLDVDSRLASAKGELAAKGRIDARKLQLVKSGSPSPQPLRIDYQARYRLTSGTGQIEVATLAAGKAQLAIGGGIDNRPAVMHLDLRVAGKQQPVDDLEPLLPVFGVVLPKDSRLSGGTASMDLAVRGPLDALVIRGPVSLDDTRLAGYSLGAKLGGALALAGINAPKDTVIHHAQAALTISPSGIQADPASAQVAQLGSMTGKGGMGADGRLDFRMLVKLDQAIAGSPTGGQGLAGLLGHSKAGRALGGVLVGASEQGIGVHVGGTASAPSFQLDPAAAAGLLKAGLGAASPPAAQPSQNKQQALNDLLQNVLKRKQKQSTGQ